MENAQSNQLVSALTCVEKGWYVFPLGEKSKQPDNEFAPNGFKSATNDPDIVREWWSKKPKNNVGIDLGRSNLTVLDFDKGLPPPELNLPETLQVSTSRGTHVYFSGASQQTNMFFNHIHIGEIKTAGGYVLGPFSLHPDGPEYLVRVKAPIAPLPLDLLDRLRPSKKQQQTFERDEHNLVMHGQIHNYLLQQAGRLRGQGLSIELIEAALLEIAHANCAPPLDESKVRQMAQSINWPPGQPQVELTLNQTPQPAQQCDPEELPDFEDEPYPRWPAWVMAGTSIYEQLVKPVCDLNERIPYFMWLPAMQLLLNYVGPKIKIKGFGGEFPFRGALYLVLIGQKGKAHKSDSVKDAQNYFNYCGLLQQAGKDTKAAEGRMLVWTAGSPEGLGLDMARTNCKNSVLFYDELSTLVSKTNIDSSALSSALLTMYESGKFSNSVKAAKETYSIDPDTYCASLIACTTDKKFPELWSKLAGADTGLDDRFMFVYQPEFLPEPRLQQQVNTVMNSQVTRRLIDRAVDQRKVYEFEDRNHPMLVELNKKEPRYAARAERWAVGLAIDLGLDQVDSECVERACAIVNYEIAVKKYLKSYEAVTREGEIQLKVSRILEMNKGRMEKRKLEAAVDYRKYGLTIWKQSYNAMTGAGIIREDGPGTRSQPCYVQLLRKRDVDDE